jgi:hypothetical protein
LANAIYDYQKPQNTYTLDQYIACQSDSIACYKNLSFIDRSGHIDYSTWNVASDYVDELRDLCVSVELSDEELDRYKYRPKLLCFKIYENAELAFLILIINDMYSSKQFNTKHLLLPQRSVMRNITKQLMNSNRTAIVAYNNKIHTPVSY